MTRVVKQKEAIEVFANDADSISVTQGGGDDPNLICIEFDDVEAIVRALRDERDRER